MRHSAVVCFDVELHLPTLSQDAYDLFAIDMVREVRTVGCGSLPRQI